MPNNKKKSTLSVPVLARVEGEGALEITVKNKKIEVLKLRIFEPPRLFEKLLEGRHYSEVPDLVARICGICPVAYQMSAVLALEDLFAVDPGEWVHQMRRVFYCGEWIESHSLHIHLLATPDVLGYKTAPDMAKDYPDEVRRGLRLQSLGNKVIKLFGGRSVNPVGVKVGGFSRAPTPSEVDMLLLELRNAKSDAKDLVTWTATLDLPKQTQSFTYISLNEKQRYPVMGRRLISNTGKSIAIDQFQKYFTEYQVPHSTALHCYFDNQCYLVGPLARINLNYNFLHDDVKTALSTTGISFPSHNTFHGIVARAAEIYQSLLDAIRLLENYQTPERPYTDVIAKAGIAYGCSEAPRGILWHRYELNAAGIVLNARIVPPTSQNQAQIEQDIRHTLNRIGLDQDDAILRQCAEQVIRNYDPCISCATHFLDLTVHRLG